MTYYSDHVLKLVLNTDANLLNFFLSTLEMFSVLLTFTRTLEFFVLSPNLRVIASKSGAGRGS